MQNLFYEEPKAENKYDLFKDDEPYQKKELRKSKTDKIFLGVCGGLGNYYSINPVFVRLVFSVGILIGGLGIIAYILLFLFVPKSEIVDEKNISQQISFHNSKSLLGITLIFIGLYFFMMPKDYFPFLFFIKIPLDIILPIVFIMVGLWRYKNFNINSSRGNKAEFLRPRKGRLFLGVCVGMSEYLGTYSIVVRLLFIVFSFTTVGFGVLLYFLIALLSKTDLRLEVEK
ncbi:MAG: PspC domain-containing protein [Bacteroidota bacterium]